MAGGLEGWRAGWLDDSVIGLRLAMRLPMALRRLRVGLAQEVLAPLPAQEDSVLGMKSISIPISCHINKYPPNAKVVRLCMSQGLGYYYGLPWSGWAMSSPSTSASQFPFPSPFGMRGETGLEALATS